MVSSQRSSPPTTPCAISPDRDWISMNQSLDPKIYILRVPSSISYFLSFRQVYSKVFNLSFTPSHKQMEVWIVSIHALNRICHENLPLLPSFPILDMSGLWCRIGTCGYCSITILSFSEMRMNFYLIALTRIIQNPLASMLK